MKFNTVSLISDYGLKDGSVGTIKSILYSECPQLKTIDISHEIEPHDVRTAGLMLLQAANYMAPGLVIGTVGSATRYIAIELGDGETVLLGPDNGLFAPVVGLVGSVKTVIELPEKPTLFAGRDVLAPTAIRLCRGKSLVDFGQMIEPDSLVPAMLPFAHNENGITQADVLYVDNFGNLMLNISTDETNFQKIKIKEREFKLCANASYAELADEELGLINDEATGFAFIVMKKGSVAQKLNITIDSTIFLS